MMDEKKLAKDVYQALGQAGDPSAEISGMMEAIVEHLKTVAIVNFLPNSVLGTAPSGGPLQNGSASLGMIVGPAGPALATLMATKMKKEGPTPQLIGLASGFCTHLLTATVNFATGNITGVCTNTPSSPGPVTGQGTKGQVTGIAGPACANLVATGIGQPSASPQLISKWTAVIDFLQKSAEVSLPPGSVIATAPPGGGPIAAGVATGGKFN
jgi:hypothetical protein